MPNATDAPAKPVNRLSSHQGRVPTERLAREIENLAASEATIDGFFREFLNHLVDGLDVHGGAVWLGKGDRLDLLCHVKLEDTGLTDRAAGTFNQSRLTNVLQTGESSVHQPNEQAGQDVGLRNPVLTVPVRYKQGCAGVVEVFDHPDNPQAAMETLALVEEMCGYASRYLEQQEVRPPAIDSPDFSRSLRQLTLSLQRTLVTSDVARTAVNDGRLVIGCDRLSLVVRQGSGARTLAISGQERINRRSNVVRSLNALAARVLATGEPLVCTGAVDEFAPQIQQPLVEFLQASGARRVMLLPLCQPAVPLRPDQTTAPANDSRSRVRGVLIVEQFAGSLPDPELRPRAELVAEHLGPVLAHALANGRIFLRSLWLSLGESLAWLFGRRLWATLAVITALIGGGIALAVIPWTYRVEAQGKLMPVLRRQVFAPSDGSVLTIQVKSGDRVEIGQVLITLKNDELQQQLQQAQNSLNEKRQQLASTKAELEALDPGATPDQEIQLHGKHQQIQAEIEGIDQQLQLLEEETAGLTIHAAQAGTVTTFHLDQLLSNRPVRRGELLLEIMDESGPWQLEVDVPERRMGHLLRASQRQPVPANGDAPAGLPVEFVMATAPETAYTGQVWEMSTRTAVSQQQETVVPVIISTETAALPQRRIGAEVRARVACGQHSLGYVLFGDAVDLVRRWLWL